MAKCDEGYLCEVCGEEVANITESDLYLRYVIGEINSDQLLAAPERHIRCNPVLGQFIDDPKFGPLQAEGPFAKSELDDEYVAEQTSLVTRGWHRLREVHRLQLPISDYPLAKTPESS